MVWLMSHLFFKGVSDDIYLTVAHFADPLPPLASSAGLADLNFTRVQQICLGFAYV